MDPHCINLKERYGRRYRVVPEESYQGEYGDGARTPDPWLLTIPCRFGHVFPHGSDLLAASVDGHPKLANRLRKLKCCEVHQDGNFGELTVLFDVADFAKVARIMRPRRRRQISETERQRLRAMGLTKGQEPRLDVEYTARRRDPAAQDDSEPVGQQMALFEP